MNRGSRNFNTIRASGTRVRDREHGKQKGMERKLNVFRIDFFCIFFFILYRNCEGTFCFGRFDFFGVLWWDRLTWLSVKMIGKCAKKSTRRRRERLRTGGCVFQN